jgi:two-component system, sensor histidine kinase and response regulator
MAPHSDLDRDELLARMGGDRELLREVIDAFLAEVPERLAALRAAAAAGDCHSVKRTAHSFKGSITIFPSPAALAAITAVEHAGLADDRDGAERAIESLTAAIDRLAADLREADA